MSDMNTPTLGITISRGWRLCAINYTTCACRLEDILHGTWHFLVRDGVDLLQALRASIVAWSADVRNAKQAPPDEVIFEYAQNWGDWLNDCPAEILLANGLVFAPLSPTDVLPIDHDELVVDSEGTLLLGAGQPA